MSRISGIRPDGARGGRAFRRPDRRRRHLRDRRRLPPHQAVPRHELRRARGAGELRRHLAHPPLSRHPLRQRPLHLRLSLQAVDRRADRHRRRDPAATWARSSTRTTSAATSATGTGSPRRAGRATTTAGPSRPPAPTPARRSASPPNFLWMCQGYYRHAEGYTPEWAGMDDFKGRIVHPQTWPEDLDYAGKKVVVIGSGATAATLIPAIAADCAPRHDAAALADLFPHRPQRDRRSPTSCASSRSTRPGSTRSCAGRSCTSRPSSPAARSPSRRR